jgi:DNA-binding MarR family transcriptional regulator
MSDSIHEAIMAYLKALAVIDPIRLRFWDGRGVTMTQLRVMHLIRFKCEPSTGELAEELRVRPATLTGLADRLEQKGLIRRWPDTSDRRVVRVGLTDEGAVLLDEVAAAGHEFLARIFRCMGPEPTDEFTKALQVFIDTAASSQTELEDPLKDAEIAL